jgi:hypothetical protein
MTAQYAAVVNKKRLVILIIDDSSQDFDNGYSKDLLGNTSNISSEPGDKETPEGCLP